MPTTSNFGWTTPADTDLVKDGAAAIRTLGNGIDTSLVDLKGGTTGQVLSKASNTDLDFTWTADASGIPATIFDAKGDIIAASAADTAARLAVGANDTVLTADSSTATGLKWAAPSSGGMTLISTTNLTGASVSLTSIPSTYVHLQLVIRNFRPALDNDDLRLQFNSDTASRYRSSSTMSQSAQTPNIDGISLSDGNDDTTSNSLIIVNIWDYTNTNTWKLTLSHSITTNSSTTTNFNTSLKYGMYNQTGAISSIQLFPSSSNFNAGSVILYGVK